MLGNKAVCKTHKHKEPKYAKKIRANKDTRNYTGSPNYGYFLFLLLQFYYDDEELQEMITQLSFYSSQSLKPLNSQRVFLLFLSEKTGILRHSHMLKASLF